MFTCSFSSVSITIFQNVCVCEPFPKFGHLFCRDVKWHLILLTFLLVWTWHHKWPYLIIPITIVFLFTHSSLQLDKQTEKMQCSVLGSVCVLNCSWPTAGTVGETIIQTPTGCLLSAPTGNAIAVWFGTEWITEHFEIRPPNPLMNSSGQ